MLALTLFAPIALAAAPSQAADTAALTALVDRFVAAQSAFDQAALARLTSPEYVEVSPIGEVDPRARMLGFYAPDNKRPAPAVVVTEREVRVFGGTGILTARLAYGPAAMRAVYVARRAARGWVLVSAQYTPIRPPRPS